MTPQDRCSTRNWLYAWLWRASVYRCALATATPSCSAISRSVERPVPPYMRPGKRWREHEQAAEFLVVTDGHDQVRAQSIHAGEQAFALHAGGAAVQVLRGHVGHARAHLLADGIVEGKVPRVFLRHALFVKSACLQEKDADLRGADRPPQDGRKTFEQFGKDRHRLHDVRHAGHGRLEVHVGGGQDFPGDALQRRGGGIDQQRHRDARTRESGRSPNGCSAIQRRAGTRTRPPRKPPPRTTPAANKTTPAATPSAR